MNIALRFSLLLTAATVLTQPAWGAGVLDFFKRKPAGNAAAAGGVAALSQDQMVDGLKEALRNGVEKAVGSIGRLGGLGNSLLGKEMPDLDGYVTRVPMHGACSDLV